MVGKADSGAVTVIHKPQGIIDSVLCQNGAAIHQIICCDAIHCLAGADTVAVVGIAGDFSIHRGGSQLASCPSKAHVVAVGKRITDLIISDGLAVIAGQYIFPVVIIVGVRNIEECVSRLTGGIEIVSDPSNISAHIIVVGDCVPGLLVIHTDKLI